MEERGLCGIEWAVWTRAGCVEESRLCGSVWAVWIRLGNVD